MWIRILAWLWLGAAVALAQDFKVNSHVIIRLSPDGKTRVLLRGQPRPGSAPSMASLKLAHASYGGGDIAFDRISDMSRLTPATRAGRSTTGLTTSRPEKRSIAWISDGPQGGCLVLDDISRAHWNTDHDLTVDPARTPVLASIWLSKDDLRKLTDTVYKVMSARSDLLRHQ